MGDSSSVRAASLCQVLLLASSRCCFRFWVQAHRAFFPYQTHSFCCIFTIYIPSNSHLGQVCGNTVGRLIVLASSVCIIGLHQWQNAFIWSWTDTFLHLPFNILVVFQIRNVHHLRFSILLWFANSYRQIQWVIMGDSLNLTSGRPYLPDTYFEVSPLPDLIAWGEHREELKRRSDASRGNTSLWNFESLGQSPFFGLPACCHLCLFAVIWLFDDVYKTWILAVNSLVSVIWCD